MRRSLGRREEGGLVKGHEEEESRLVLWVFGRGMFDSVEEEGGRRVGWMKGEKNWSDLGDQRRR